MRSNALVFDMDGVLVDSEPLWRRAEIATFEDVGVRLTESDCSETTGLRIDECVAYWYERRPWTGVSISDLAARIVSRMEELIAEDAEAIPGVVDALERARAGDWRISLASSSPKRLIDAVLGRLEIGDYFESTHSAEYETHGKPHPGIYLSAVRALELPPEACIAIEDSANGVRSALAAGLRCVAIPEREARDRAGITDATWQLESIGELPGKIFEIEESLDANLGMTHI